MLGRELINSSTANYLGLAYHPHVVAAAKEAIGPVRNVGVGRPRGIRGDTAVFRIERQLANTSDRCGQHVERLDDLLPR
jgi:7-keto-8-aminopelargonate synthetase-like enzyme